MKIIPSERGLHIVDFPVWIGVLALPLAIFLGIKFVAHILSDGPWSQSAAILLGALVAEVGGAMLTRHNAVQFDTIKSSVTWCRRSIFGLRKKEIHR